MADAGAIEVSHQQHVHLPDAPEAPEERRYAVDARLVERVLASNEALVGRLVNIAEALADRAKEETRAAREEVRREAEVRARLHEQHMRLLEEREAVSAERAQQADSPAEAAARAGAYDVVLGILAKLGGLPLDGGTPDLGALVGSMSNEDKQAVAALVTSGAGGK